jgi:CubicO group peptidase (beta-lactamase class C family)
MRTTLIVFTIISVFASTTRAQTSLYFPPIVGNQWQTTDPSTLGYCQERIDSLYHFLGQQNTKGFILLKDGKIVLEKYFGTFTVDSSWYWASAGKSLSAYLLGAASDAHGVDINAPVSTYLGANWTTAPPDKEALIQVHHLLSMSSGLDESVSVPGTDPSTCTSPACMQYKADAGTRWAYHNGAYFQVHKLVEKVSGQTINQFTKTKLLDRIGSKGLWLNGVMYSTPRNMARFGLLALANGVWSSDSIIKQQAYVQAMTNTSQQMNKSYGYLWWLNGKSSFMLPGLQFQIPNSLITNAPSDMYAALGKDDQKIHVVPSKGMVIVRMGNVSNYVLPTGNTVPIAFDNEMWRYINALTCITDETEPLNNVMMVSPNPTSQIWSINFAHDMHLPWRLYDSLGRLVQTGKLDGEVLNISAESLAPNVYWLVCGALRIKLMKK